MVSSTLSSYKGNIKLNSVNFEISTSHENAIRLFNDLFEEGNFEEILTYFAFCGIYVDTRKATKIVLRTKNEDMSYVWVKRKD